ncbi:alpha-1-acid glycoprotein 1 [Gracilinanus agilis]|uniref:alpha-1-acid glycoprotein 1 n=1 Tax=Gracilinanus agilis TaxID=191870 RepID=UPI001CFCB3B5|nr:alpha-1-acid glycoprotein 1 [Gracilinanus agilis]
MVLYWAFIILSFAPVLLAQQPVCTSLTPMILNDTTIDQLSGKWYYIGAAIGYLPYKEETQSIKSSFFYMIPNKTEDIFFGNEYNTIGDKCVYMQMNLTIDRANGTLLRNESNHLFVSYVAWTQDPNTFVLYFFPMDRNLRSVFLSVRTPEASEEQLKEFREIAKCLGFQEEDIIYTDWSKDMCKQLEKEHNQKEKKEAKDVSKEKELS